MVHWNESVDEGSDLRRAHLLALEHDLANLEADLGVVDDLGGLSCESS